MMIGLFGYLDGYKGNFDFDKPGTMYEDVPYQGMRLVRFLLNFLFPIIFINILDFEIIFI